MIRSVKEIEKNPFIGAHNHQAEAGGDFSAWVDHNPSNDHEQKTPRPALRAPVFQATPEDMMVMIREQSLRQPLTGQHLQDENPYERYAEQPSEHDTTGQYVFDFYYIEPRQHRHTRAAV